MRTRIDVLADYFLPGYLGGGQLRSVENFARTFRDQYSIRVITGDKDFGLAKPYPLEAREVVRKDSKIDVQYLPGGLSAFSMQRKLIQGNPPDLLYLNSVFSPLFALCPLIISSFGTRIKVLIAPRGGLLSPALSSRAMTRSLYLTLARVFRLFRKVHWHATSDDEADAIVASGLGRQGIHIVPELPSSSEPFAKGLAPLKRPGSLRLLFVGRIESHKGLARLLKWLHEVPGSVQLRIIGQVADEAYGDLCRFMASQLPTSTTIEWMGALPHARVLQEYCTSHLYVLPTQSENFGYTIQESLQAGCPVLTSMSTPWKDLASLGAGVVCHLEDEAAWISALRRFVAMAESEMTEIREKARMHCMLFGDAVFKTQSMLDRVLSGD